VLKSKSPDKSSKENKFAGVLASGSVIVYVWRQRDTEVVAENLASAGVKGGVVIYHGGMDASSRTKAQSKVGCMKEMFVLPCASPG
jgi:ATP-dependent DNA helicase Q4